jgi:hypothetical protein
MKYLLTLIGEEGGMEDASPEEMKAIMDAWASYTQETIDKGAFLAGEGLQPTATATTVHVPRDGGERTVTDGPFAESKEVLGGFYLLDCRDLDEALDWAKKVPVQDGAVEVRPVMDYEARGYEVDAGGHPAGARS